MADIDATKNVYLFTHGRQDLIEKSTDALVSNGFSKDKINGLKCPKCQQNNNNWR